MTFHGTIPPVRNPIVAMDLNSVLMKIDKMAYTVCTRHTFSLRVAIFLHMSLYENISISFILKFVNKNSIAYVHELSLLNEN